MTCWLLTLLLKRPVDKGRGVFRRHEQDTAVISHHHPARQHSRAATADRHIQRAADVIEPGRDWRQTAAPDGEAKIENFQAVRCRPVNDNSLTSSGFDCAGYTTAKTGMFVIPKPVDHQHVTRSQSACHIMQQS